jgi:preprotein translocase subunit SecD
MSIGRNRFNLYLACLLALAVGAGCRTQAGKEKKQIATLRIHVEVIPEPMDFSSTVKVFREKPILLTVDKAPFLTEANVSEAKVVDVAGGFDLQIKFDRQGTWLFEEYTTTHPGKHLAIFSAFVDKKKKEARWLAAPLIQGRNSKGVLTFTPDANREECEAIARGLNNVAEKNRKDSQW